MLLFIPTQELDDLHLGTYIVLDREPLHDLKEPLQGATTHTTPRSERKIQEIYNRGQCQRKVTRTDHRMITTELYLLLAQASFDPMILLLVDIRSGQNL